MSSFFSSLTSGFGDFVSRRRRPLTVLAGVAGGVYLVASYARNKLDGFQEGLGKARASRENLRRRFQQNQEDCGFTVLALLPSLGTQILEGMDVEALTAKLASLGKVKPKAPVVAVAAGSRDEGMEAAGDAPAAAGQANGNGLSSTDGDVANEKGEGAPHTRAEGISKSGLDPSAKPFAPSAPADNRTEPSDPNDIDRLARAGSEDTGANGTAETAEETMPTDATSIPTIPSTYDLADHSEPLKVSVPATKHAPLEASIPSLATPNASAFLPEKPANGFEALDAPAPHVVSNAPAPQPNGALTESSPPTTDQGKGKLDGMTKAEVWAELKLLSFSRLLTSIYCLALLALQTHIQLNLLGRYAYVSSVLTMAEDEDPTMNLLDGVDDSKLRAVDLRTERRYLTFSWWLLHRGWEEVALRVREKVGEVIGPMGLKDTVSGKDLKMMLDQIRRKVERENDGSPFNFAAALFPPTTVSELETLRAGGMPPHDCIVDPPLRDLLDETADFIDAPDFPRVLDATVGKVLAIVSEKVGDAAGLAPMEEEIAAAAAAAQGSAGGPFIHPRLRFQEVLPDGPQEEVKKVRLANLLPIVSRQAHLVLNGLPNECAEALSSTRELLEFSSLVYTLS